MPPRHLRTEGGSLGESYSFFKRVFFRIFICGLKALETFDVKPNKRKNSEHVWQIVGQTETKGMDFCVYA